MQTVRCSTYVKNIQHKYQVVGASSTGRNLKLAYIYLQHFVCTFFNTEFLVYIIKNRNCRSKQLQGNSFFCVYSVTFHIFFNCLCFLFDLIPLVILNFPQHIFFCSQHFLNIGIIAEGFLGLFFFTLPHS